MYNCQKNNAFQPTIAIMKEYEHVDPQYGSRREISLVNLGLLKTIYY